MRLTLLAGAFTICRLGPHAAIPDWSLAGGFLSVTRTSKELSIVCSSELVPSDVLSEPGWRCLEVEGPLDFSMTGVIAALSGALAGAEVSLFAVSTFDTDYILVKDPKGAAAALTAAGHSVIMQ